MAGIAETDPVLEGSGIEAPVERNVRRMFGFL